MTNFYEVLTDRGLRAEYARLLATIDAEGGYRPDTEDLTNYIALSDVRDTLLERGIDIEAEYRLTELAIRRDAQRAGGEVVVMAPNPFDAPDDTEAYDAFVADPIGYLAKVVEDDRVAAEAYLQARYAEEALTNNACPWCGTPREEEI